MSKYGWIKPAALGAVVGAAGFTVLSTGAGWLVTSDSALQQAESQAKQAVIAALTPICVSEFRALSDAKEQQHIAALDEESTWQQGDYVEEQGWATIPGDKEPNEDVAEACAEQLLDASDS